MNSIVSYFGEAFGELSSLSPLNQILALVTVLTGCGFVWNRLRFRRADREAARANAARDAAETNLDHATKELVRKQAHLDTLQTELDQTHPGHWVSLAQEQENLGNGRAAAEILQIGYDNIYDDLARALMLLSSLLADEALGDVEQCRKAIITTQQALTIAPNGDLEARLEQLQLMEKEGLDPKVANLVVNSRTQSPEDAVRTLFDGAQKLRAAGLYLQAQQIVAASLRKGKRLGPRHPGVLATRHLEAGLLRDIGEPQQALDKVKDLLPLREEVQGPRHSGVLVTRHLEASLLRHIGESQQALDKVKDLLPLQEEVLGPRHPGVLATRHLEAGLLRDIGEPQQALDKVKDLLPLQEEVEGPRHPGVLATRYLEAGLLRDIGEPQQALDKVKGLLPLREEVQGPRHSDVLVTRHLEASLLRHIGESQQALDKVKDLLPLREEVQGPRHPGVLRTYYLKAKILGELKQTTEALSVVKRLPKAFQDVGLIESHRYVSEAHNLIQILMEEKGAA